SAFPASFYCVLSFSMQEHNYVRISLLIFSLIVLYFVFRIFQAFLLPISLAVVLVTLCYPIFDWTSRQLKGKRSWAALLTCIWITASIIIPFVVLLILLAGEVGEVYQQVQRRLESGSYQDILDLKDTPYVKPLIDWISPYFDLENIDIVGSFTTGFRQISLFFLRQSTAILSSLFHVIADFLVMLVTMFFLFRDGSRLVKEIKNLTPLSQRYEQLIITKFQEVATATVLGTLLTALAQGIAGGLLFWVLGISNALFWGFLMGLFSLLPVVGTGIVWAPWAIYFFVTTSVIQGIILVAGGLLVGLIDNVLRPLFIEGKAEMHTLIVFLAIMGGINYFGMVGMIFGPITVALGLTFLELYKEEFRQELSEFEEE
ncbi:AI-2E family transporter, partial [Acidobacteria bacterium AH-259-D05]|nr:AI-2E family transporter [Acidobacteria bacterium AH-259-D05]